MYEWKGMFDTFGIKRVTKTDKRKQAYVLTAEQKAAFTAAGVEPAAERPAPALQLGVLFEQPGATVEASYYYSLRSEDARRSPEPRLGREIVTSWMKEGERIVIGNIGDQVFVAKAENGVPSGPGVATDLAAQVDPEEILRRAANASGPPATTFRQRKEFVRNAYVVAGAVVRSEGACEMPGCTIPLFTREDGTPFLEVHHVIPLAEGGDDTLENAAALCPMCHRELHFGAERSQKRNSLLTAIPPK